MCKNDTTEIIEKVDCSKNKEILTISGKKNDIQKSFKLDIISNANAFFSLEDFPLLFIDVSDHNCTLCINCSFEILMKVLALFWFFYISL
jgi:hypothetical protein